jgi:hypothetical protein
VAIIVAKVQDVSTPNDEWRALSPATRRVVWRNARRFQAHPDPAVSAVAARYARWYLDARTWHARTQRLALGVVIVDIIVAAGVLGWLSGGPAATRPSTLDKTLIWLVAVVIAAAVVVPYAVRKGRIIRRYRLELASKLTLESVAVAASAAPAAGPLPSAASALATASAPPTGRELSVRYDRRRVLRQSAWLLGVVCCMAVVLVGQGLSAGITVTFDALCAFLVFFALLIVVPQAVLLVRWVLPARPIVELDADGVHMPSIACHVPWDSLAEVRLVPMRYAKRGTQGAVVVAFVPQDPPALLAGITGVSRSRKRRLERSLRVYGTPMSVSDNAIDHPAEQIAAAAGAFAVVPVRRY